MKERPDQAESRLLVPRQVQLEHVPRSHEAVEPEDEERIDGHAEDVDRGWLEQVQGLVEIQPPPEEVVHRESRHG